MHARLGALLCMKHHTSELLRWMPWRRHVTSTLVQDQRRDGAARIRYKLNLGIWLHTEEAWMALFDAEIDDR
jgi:hypothetical protein